MKHTRTLAIIIALFTIALTGCAAHSAPASTHTVTPPRPTATSTPAPVLPFARTGYTLPKGVTAPYADRPIVDVNKQEIDGDGVAVWRLKSDGKRYDHPVAYAP
jgi:hypothetical protein